MLLRVVCGIHIIVDVKSFVSIFDLKGFLKLHNTIMDLLGKPFLEHVLFLGGIPLGGRKPAVELCEILGK